MRQELTVASCVVSACRQRLLSTKRPYVLAETYKMATFGNDNGLDRQECMQREPTKQLHRMFEPDVRKPCVSVI